MTLPDQPAPVSADDLAAHLARGADLTAVAQALTRERPRILQRWLRLAAQQPFNRENPERAVADHIPALFEAVTELLARLTGEEEPEAPMDDPAIAAAARAHAEARFRQGLRPVDIATEIRLLRQEVSKGLRRQLADSAPTDDVISAMALVNDALDGATTLALATLTERIEAVREEFLASTLHDVRQPVALIEVSLVLAARWIRRTPLDLERLTEILDGALVATHEMSHMIDTLADASRVAMGAVDLAREPVKLGAVVSAAIAGLDPASRHRIEVERSEALDAVGQWDDQSVRRVLVNLLTNALKYSPEDRPVTVRARCAAAEIELSVVDRGIGLLPEEIALLFQPYSRSEAVRSRGLPGLGLGLFAARGMIEAHGGRIDLRSAGRDLGTTVTVILPLGCIDD